jgi:hypothetical protein
MDNAGETRTVKRLDLQPEDLGNLTDRVLTTQGHSLWTCDETAHEEDGGDEPDSGPARRGR